MKEKLKDFWNNIDWGKAGVSSGAGLIGGLLFNRFVLGNKSWKSRIISGAIGTLLGGGGSALYDYYDRTGRVGKNKNRNRNRSSQQQQSTVSEQDKQLYYDADASGSKTQDAKAIPTNVYKQRREDKKLLEDRKRAKELADAPTIAKLRELEMTTRPVNAAVVGYGIGGQVDKVGQVLAGKRQPHLIIKSDNGNNIKVAVDYSRGKLNQLAGRTSGRIDATEWAKLTPNEQYRVKELIENKGVDVKLTQAQSANVPISLSTAARERASQLPEASRLREQMRTIRKSVNALKQTVASRQEALDELRRTHKANIAASDASYRAYAAAPRYTEEAMNKRYAAAQDRRRLHESARKLKQSGRELESNIKALEKAQRTKSAVWEKIVADRKARGGLKLKAPSAAKRVGHTLARHAGKILGPTVSAALTIPTATRSWEDYSRLREIGRNRGWL